MIAAPAQVSNCAGFRTPAATSYPRAPEAGVRKAPRHEIAGGTPRSAVPLAQLWGFERRTCRVHASARREVERLRRAKHAGGFALIGSGPEKRGSSSNLWDEQRICARSRTFIRAATAQPGRFWDGDRMDVIIRYRS